MAFACAVLAVRSDVETFLIQKRFHVKTFPRRHFPKRFDVAKRFHVGHAKMGKVENLISEDEKVATFSADVETFWEANPERVYKYMA